MSNSTPSIEVNTDLEMHLNRLQLRRIREVYLEQVARARVQKPDYLEFISALIQEEIDARNETRYTDRLLKARLPEYKTLEDFDFAFQTSITPAEMESLATLDFVSQKKNVIFVGPPGVGKTHLAIALAMKGITTGRKVLFTTVESLIDRLYSGSADGSTKQKLKHYGTYDFIIVDELGYMEMPLTASNLFFQFVSQVYRKRSLILTSNRPFQEWGEVFANNAIAGATLDRLLHDAIIINLKGQSYRTRGLKRAGGARSLAPPGEPMGPPQAT
jgi:DNA replication protein DnaC